MQLYYLPKSIIMYLKKIVTSTLFCSSIVFSFAQSTQVPKGNLFIIGGGNKSEALIKKLIATAELSTSDYIAILPMATEEPDTAFYYIKEDLSPATNNKIVAFNFTPDKTNNKVWLDSLRRAKLIYITGGDQSKFMKAVLHTPVYDAIHAAYNNGATIAGTSAGAAVMNKYMITGNQLLDTAYSATFDRLRDKNVEIEEGLGMIDDAIVDQHFITRSRYNRLLSALALHPDLPCIGIDEGTAIIVHDKKVTVAGASDVIEFYHPEGLQITKEGLIKFSNVCLKFFTDGDSFELK